MPVPVPEVLRERERRLDEYLAARRDRPAVDPVMAMILQAANQSGMSPTTAGVSPQTLQDALGVDAPTETGPATLGDRLGALGSWAGNAIMGRGGFGAPPYSKVMEGGKPKRVYRGTQAVYDKENPLRWDPEALYGPGAYFTENPTIASGYAGKVSAESLASVAERAADIETSMASVRESLANSRLSPVMRNYMKNRLEYYQEQLDKLPAPNVRASYLDTVKPFDADTGTISVAEAQRAVKRLLTDAGKERGPLDESFKLRDWARILENQLANRSRVGRDPEKVRIPWSELEAYAGPHAANRVLRSLGFDAITHIGGARTGHPPHRVWIGFRPEQEYSAFTPREALP